MHRTTCYLTPSVRKAGILPRRSKSHPLRQTGGKPFLTHGIESNSFTFLPTSKGWRKSGQSAFDDLSRLGETAACKSRHREIMPYLYEISIMKMSRGLLVQR